MRERQVREEELVERDEAEEEREREKYRRVDSKARWKVGRNKEG